MPTQPPKFGKAVQSPKPWISPNGRPDRRLRGRAGVALRQQVRDEEPFCRHCRLEGRMVRTNEIDHIRPLADGGTDVRSNLQGLCFDHHEAKSKAERAAERRHRGA